MSVPSVIPERLRACGFPVDSDSENELAWRADEALEIVDLLGGTKVAVVEVDVYRSEAWGFVPTDTSWACDYILGETASEFATRTQRAVREFILSENDSRQDNVLYAMIFSDQQDAA